MKKVTFLSTAAIALLFGACKNDSEFEGFTKAENGLNYKFFNHDENGVKVTEGDGITFSYIISNNKNYYFRKQNKKLNLKNKVPKTNQTKISNDKNF